MTVGGAICGYWAMDNLKAAAIPAKTIMIEITAAKMGRVIKNLLIIFSS